MLGLIIASGIALQAAQLNPKSSLQKAIKASKKTALEEAQLRQTLKESKKFHDRALAESKENAALHQVMLESKKTAEREAIERNEIAAVLERSAVDERRRKEAEKLLQATIEKSEREFKELQAKKKAANIRKFKSLQDLQIFYIEELQKEADLLKKLFLDLTGISPEEFARKKEMVREENNRDFLKESEELLPIFGNYNPNEPFKAMVILMVHKFAKELQLTNDLTILFDEQGAEKRGDSLYYMSVNPIYIQIDVPACSSLSPMILETTILHELNHIVFADAVERVSMDEILETKNKGCKKAFMQLFSFFKEKRADIAAWIRSKEHAKAGVEDFKIMTQKHDKVDERESTHQSFQNRLAIAQQIYAEMCALPNNKN